MFLARDHVKVMGRSSSFVNVTGISFVFNRLSNA